MTGADPTDVEPTVEPVPADSRRGSGFVLAVTLAVVFAVAAAVLAVLLARGPDDGLDEIRSRAGRFGEALVSYDYHDPEAHRDAVMEMSTGSFRDQYEEAFDKGLGQIITEVEAVSVAHVKDVYLSQVDSGQVEAIVVADIDHDGKGGASTLYDIYFRLTMIELDGEWLVDDVTDLSFGGGSPGVTTDTTDPTTATSVTSVP